MENKIHKMWIIQDPLLLTPYNERLLEHYSRVAYSNLFFGVKDLNIDGWQTDRGEIFIRYGQPLTVERYRPGQEVIIEEKDVRTISGKKKVPIMRQLISPKGEIWKYFDKQFAFDDIYSTGNYRFNKYGREGNIVSSFSTDTDDYIHYYRNESSQEYIPRMEGPVFDVNYQTYQFKSDERNKTKIYLGYTIRFDSLLAPMESFSEGYEMGLFFHDLYMHKQLEKKVYHPMISRNNKINSVDFDLVPEPGNIAFEIIRKKDKGTASYHGQFKVNNFSTGELTLSSLILAYKIEEEYTGETCIQRNEINIQPNPEQSFSKGKNLYLYYEVYNLTKGNDNLTDFEQKVTIQKKEEDDVLSNILDVVGLGSKGEKISTTSNYQTFEPDPQIYFQLDLSDYETGEYLLTLSITDKINKSTSTTTASLFLIE